MGRIALRALSRSSLTITLTDGQMRNPSSDRPARAAPSSSGPRRALVCSGEKNTKALRGPLEEGAARAGRSLDGFRICPSVNVMINDDLESARNAMRPIVALYVGGMGSREQNFYNRLVSSYGFERAAEEVQQLYLAGRKTEAMFALPDELIDLVCIVGPRDRVKAKLRDFRDAGVETLIVWPVMPDQEERNEQLRVIAELADG